MMHAKSRNVLSPIPRKKKKKKKTGGGRQEVGSAPLLKHPWRIFETKADAITQSNWFITSFVDLGLLSKHCLFFYFHKDQMATTKDNLQRAFHLSLLHQNCRKEKWALQSGARTQEILNHRMMAFHTPEPLYNLGEDNWHSHLWDTLATVQMMLSLLRTWAIVKKKCFIVLQH